LLILLSERRSRFALLLVLGWLLFSVAHVAPDPNTKPIASAAASLAFGFSIRRLIML
jgi:hypothetical protein